VNVFCNKSKALLLSSMLLWISPWVAADVFLTSENLNSSLKQMQRSAQQMLNNEDYETSLYILGKTADDLARLLTDEVEAHRNENEKLIELALDRSERLQVNIFWEGRVSKFFYDGKALYLYLDEYPEGQYKMDVLFRIITQEFFLSMPDGEQDLLEAIGKKESFIKDYPEHTNISEIEFYLAIDYRDLWRFYRDAQDSDKAGNTARTTTQQLEHIIDKYSDKDEGEIARRLLDRFMSEVSVDSAL
jgi:hypothetical protein